MFTKKLFAGHCLQLAFFVFVFVRFYLVVFFLVMSFARGSLQSPPTLSLPSTPDEVYGVSLNRVKLGCVAIVEGRFDDDPLFESSGRKVSVNLYGIVCSCI